MVHVHPDLDSGSDKCWRRKPIGKIRSVSEKRNQYKFVIDESYEKLKRENSPEIEKGKNELLERKLERSPTAMARDENFGRKITEKFTEA